MNFTDIKSLLDQASEVISNVKKNIVGHYAPSSLTEVTKITRVEPLTIVSKDLANFEYTPDVLQSVLSIFAGYYLQAVNVLTKVKDVEVIRILDKLNPDRDESAFLLAAESSSPVAPTLSLANYKHKLPTTATSSALEASEILTETSNLSVGKMLKVRICVNEENEKDSGTVEIPVNVRLATSLLSNSAILHLLAFKTEENSLVERYHAWRAGRISFIRDLIFCQDLIDEYKKAMVTDNTGTALEIMRRVNNAKKYGILTQNPSLVSASNIFVISEANAQELEQRLGGKLSNKRVRDKAFENTYAMLLVVVDRDYERVVIYSRGIDASTDVSFKEIRAANKNKGIDIADVLKSFTSGMQPSF